jgi:hypothetical protein
MLARVPYGLVSTDRNGRPDPFLAAIVARHAAEVQAADIRRQAIAAGMIPPPPPSGRWIVSDRD